MNRRNPPFGFYESNEVQEKRTSPKKSTSLIKSPQRSSAKKIFSTAGVIAGVTLLGYVIYKTFSQEKNTELVKEFIHVQRPGQLVSTTIEANKNIEYQVSWVNNSPDKDISVTWKFGVRNHDAGARYETNQSDYSEILPAGQSGITTLSRHIPSDWGGYIFDARVLISGGDDTGSDLVDEIFNLACSEPQENPSEDEIDVIDTSIEPVHYFIALGEKAKVRITVANKESSTITKRYRLDIRTTAPGMTQWCNGFWKSQTLAPNETRDFELESVSSSNLIWPSSDAVGWPVAAKIMIDGDQDPAWGQVSLSNSQPYQLFYVVPTNGVELQDENNLIITNIIPTDHKLSNGQSFSVTMRIIYKGGGREFLFGVGLKDGSANGVWAKTIGELPESIDWTTCLVTVNGIFNSTLGSGRSIDVIKAIQTIGAQLYISGQNMIKADWDRDVFVVR